MASHIQFNQISSSDNKLYNRIKKSELCLINVYLPYCSIGNTDDFLAYWGKMKQLCNELQCPNICFVGTSMLGPQILLELC